MLLVLLLGALSAGAARAAVIEDFERPPAMAIHQGETRGGSFSCEAAPQSAGKAGRIQWRAEHAAYLEMHYQDPRPLPEFDQELNGVLSLRVYGEAGSAVRRIALRLRDAHGEVFQWSKPLSFPVSGWSELSFRVTPDTVEDSWGPQKDGKIDLPVRLLGFSVSFDAKALGAGSVFLDDVRAVGAGARVETRRPLWRFDDGERWRVGGEGARLTRLQTAPEGLLLTCQPSDKEVQVPLTERMFSVVSCGNPDALSLECDLLSGSGARFGLRLRDAKGEVFALAGKTLSPGRNTLTWKIPDDRQGQSWGDNRDGVLDAPVRLYELFFTREASAGETRIRLRAAEIRERLPALEALQVGVETGNPIHVLKVGEEGKLSLRLTNTAAVPVAFRARVRLEAFGGEMQTLERDFLLAPQAESAWPLPAPSRLGIWWVDYRLQAPDGAGEAAGRRSFAYLRPAGPTPEKASGFLFSICTHTERWSPRDAEREVLAAGLCGAKVIRTGVGWEGIQPAAGVWRWQELDQLVAMYAAQGMELQYLLGFCPGWAVANQAALQRGWDYYKGQSPRMDAWRAYVSAVAARYKERIRYWEVWNEPDIGFWTGTLDEYLQLLQAASEEIHKVDPRLRVMTGGFAIYERNPRFIEGVVERGQRWFDIFAYHRHGGFEPFRREVEGPVAALRAKLTPAKPIYFNETAIGTPDERLQAETLFKKLTFAWARGAMGYTWYDLRNDGFNPKDPEHTYGMLTNDFYPKAVYPAYNTLALLLKGKSFERELPVGTDRLAFLFAGRNERVLAAWSDVPGGAEEHLVLKTDARAAFAVDLMGNRKPVPVADGRVVLAISATPGYLVLEGSQAAPTLEGALAQCRGAQLAVPGRPMPVEVELFNPTAQSRRILLTCRAPESLGGGSASIGVDVPAGARKPARVLLALPAGALSRSGGTQALQLTYRIEGTAWAGTLQAPVHLAALVPAGGPNREPDFRLESRAQVVNRFENDPHSAALTWKGLDDLSARVWLGRYRPPTGGGACAGMTLRVLVRDDAFSQPFRGGETWRGDSLQAAFQVPGQSGYWEVSLARLADGAPSVVCTSRPTGFDDPSARVALRTEPQPGGMLYEAVFPSAAFGLTDVVLRQGIRFNLLVNDNDGAERKGWIQIADGIGMGKDPSRFPFVVFEETH